jgi:hypothetical protein
MVLTLILVKGFLERRSLLNIQFLALVEALVTRFTIIIIIIIITIILDDVVVACTLIV